MIKSSVEKMANAIGFDIGISNDEAQADLLNGFCKGLKNSMQDFDLNTQLCSIVEHLDRKSCSVIKALNEFVELKEKDE